MFMHENLRWTARLFLVLAVMVSYAPSVMAQELTAQEMMERLEKLLWGRTNQAQFQLTITTSDWQRTLRARVWMQRPERTFIRILSPAREAGVGTLRIGTEMWNYLPRVDRVIKIPPSMMLQPWMGSDFTNDDLVKESSLAQDYTHTILGVEDRPEGRIYRVQALPKPDAPVVWGKLIYWVREQDLIPLREEFYNERGELIKELVFSEVRSLGGRIIPTRWEMRSLKKPDHLTVMVMEEITFDEPIADEIFTLRNLQNTE